jgi:uncharacterized membrane protein YhdT
MRHSAIKEEGPIIYTNGDGLWFRCACLKKPVLLHQMHHPVITMVEMQELVNKHGHH